MGNHDGRVKSAILCVLLSLPLMLVASAFCPARAASEEAGRLYEKGNSLFKQGKYRDAEEYYERAIEQVKDFAPLYYNLAKTQAELGEYEKAMDSYREFLRLRPTGDKAREAEASMRRLESKLKGGESAREARMSGSQETWQEPITGMEFVWVPKGCYKMGCGTWTSYCYSRDNSVHEVCVDGFWMGKYEVTQEQWKQIMGSNPSYYKTVINGPVEQVSWTDVNQFISKLNTMGGSRHQFRLPTEAEWEYACRSGGREEEFAGGLKDPNLVGWNRDNSDSTTHAVGSKGPNGLGIYDMSGNVWEWCQDEYTSDPFVDQTRKNPVHTGSLGSDRVIRGGTFDWHSCYSNCAYRYSGRDRPSYDIGIRLVRKP